MENKWLFGALIILFYLSKFSVEAGGLKTGGENVCSHNVTFTYSKVVNTTRWVRRYSYWCSNRVTRFFGYCPNYYRIRIRYYWQLVTRTRSRLFRKQSVVNVCCSGYRKEGDTCPVPICDGGCLNGNCASPNNCTCNAGYTGNNCKDDVDECAVNNGKCEQVCVNLEGSFKCGCNKGYQISKFFPNECDDLNECELSDGLCECASSGNGCEATCQNIKGSYVCNCSEGFSTDNNRHCHDFNECHRDNGECSSICENHEGGYKCLCPYGFELGADNKTCIDINECNIENGGCKKECKNTEGSFECLCPKGFVLDANGKTCSDHDECKNSTHGCEQLCENYHGAYACACNKGFKINSDNLTCSDINECEERLMITKGSEFKTLSGCTQRCNNTVGSFACYCYDGYKLFSDGKTCIDVDECEEGKSLCESKCVNTDGSYSCDCERGYKIGEQFYQCVGEPCGDLLQVENSQASCLKGATGDNCTFACHKGFTLTGSETRWCLPNHKWNGTTTRCQRNRCPTLQPPLNAGLSLPCTPYFNSSCQVICDPGFVLNGTASERTCIVGANDQMEWDNSDVRCVESGICTPNPCNNSGECTIDGNTVSCICKLGYKGERCEIGVVSILQPKTLTVNQTIKDIVIVAKPEQQVNIKILPSDSSVTATPQVVNITFPETSSSFSLKASKPGLYQLDFELSGQSANVFEQPRKLLVYVIGNYTNTNSFTYESPITSEGLLKPGCFVDNEHGIVSSNSPFDAKFTSNIVQLMVGNGQYAPLSISGDTMYNRTSFTVNRNNCFSGENSDQYISEIIHTNAFAYTAFELFNMLAPYWIKVKIPLSIDRFVTSDFEGKVLDGNKLSKSKCGSKININNTSDYYVYSTRQEIQILTPNGNDIIQRGSKTCLIKRIGNDEVFVVFDSDSEIKILESLKDFLVYDDKNLDAVFGRDNDGYINAIGIINSTTSDVFTNGLRKISYFKRAEAIIQGSLMGKQIWKTSMSDIPFTMTDGEMSLRTFFFTPRLPFAMDFKGEIEKVRWSSLPVLSNDSCQQGILLTTTFNPTKASVTPDVIFYDTGNSSLMIRALFSQQTRRITAVNGPEKLTFKYIESLPQPYTEELTKLNQTLNTIKDMQQKIISQPELPEKVLLTITFRDLLVKTQRTANILLEKKYPVLNDSEVRETLTSILKLNITNSFRNLQNISNGEKILKLFEVDGKGRLCFSENYCFQSLNDLFYGNLYNHCIKGNNLNNSIIIKSKVTRNEDFGGLFQLNPQNLIKITTNPYLIKTLTNWTFYGDILNQSRLEIIPNTEASIIDISRNNEVGEDVIVIATAPAKGITKDDEIVFNIRGQFLDNGTLITNIEKRFKQDLIEIKNFVELRENTAKMNIEKAKELVITKSALYEQKKNETNVVRNNLFNLSNNITELKEQIEQAKQKIRNTTLLKGEIERFLNNCASEKCVSRQCIPGTIVDICQDDEVKLYAKEKCKIVPKLFQKMTLEKKNQTELKITYQRQRVCFAVCPSYFGFYGYFSFYWRPRWRMSYYMRCRYRYVPTLTFSTVTLGENKLVNYTLNISVCEPNSVVTVNLPGGKTRECRKFSNCSTLVENSNCTKKLKECNEIQQELKALELDLEYQQALDNIKHTTTKLGILLLNKRIQTRRLGNAEKTLEASKAQAILANSSLLKSQNDKISLQEDTKYVKIIIEDTLKNNKTVKVKNIIFEFDHVHGMKYPRRLVIRLLLDNEISSSQETISLLDIDNKEDSIVEITNDIFKKIISDLKSSSGRKRRSLDTDSRNINVIQLKLHEKCNEIQDAYSFVASFLSDIAKEIEQFEEMRNNTNDISNQQNQFIKDLENKYKEILDFTALTDNISFLMKEDNDLPAWMDLYDSFIVKQDRLIRFSNTTKCFNVQDCIIYHISIIQKYFHTHTVITSRNITRWQKNLLDLSRGNLTVRDTEHLVESIVPLVKSNVTQIYCGNPPQIDNIDHRIITYKEGDLLNLQFNTVESIHATNIIWRLNGKILNNEYSKTLHKNATKETTGLYTCEISNMFGSANCGSWEVIVHGHPVITKPPESVNLYVKSPEEQYLSCLASDSNEIAWIFQPFDFIDKPITLGESNSTLKITESHNSGYYWCEASNKFFKTESNKVIVNILPTSIAYPTLKLQMTISKKVNLRQKRDTVLFTNQQSSLKIQLISMLNTSVTNIEYSSSYITFQISGKDITEKLANVKSWDDITNNAMQEREEIMDAAGRFYINARSQVIKIGEDSYEIYGNSIQMKEVKVACPNGKILHENGFICGDCPTGTHEHSGKCVSCSKNSYQSSSGQWECNPCPAYTFTKDIKTLSRAGCIQDKSTLTTPSSEYNDIQTSNQESTTAVTSIIVVVILILLMSVILVYFVWRRKIRKLKYLPNTNNHISSCTNPIYSIEDEMTYPNK